MSLAEPVPKDRGTVLAEERTDLALQRTIIAADRTLMAWIRTALSMIGFGFTIYKFFQYQAEDIAAGNIRRPQAPRNLGLSLIALGNAGISSRNLAAPEVSESDWGIREATYDLHLGRGRDGCHPDWTGHLLRRSAATRAVLIKRKLRVSSNRFPDQIHEREESERGVTEPPLLRTFK